MLLGTHVSIAGGYGNALTEARRLGIDTMQLFTRNQRMWKEKTVSKEEGLAFKNAFAAHGIKQAFSHAIYLVSLGSEDETIAQKSIAAMIAELERCHTLGLTHTVLHPGSAGTRTPEAALTVISSRIKTILQATKNNPVKILLENTAGHGTGVSATIEGLAALVKQLRSSRIGICIDTCHAFAAGYDIRTSKGLEIFLKGIDQLIGLDKLLCFHLNDSKGGLGSKLDRHAHIGEGQLGLEPFRYIMQHFQHIPKVLETSKENGADQKNLQLLRKLARKV